MKENRRKCLKCGSSPCEDPNITLHRFPKPGTTNFVRCELWAKYCFPHESWSSPKFHEQLYSEHRMLCTKHFKKSSFMDNAGKKLFRFAAPDTECDEANKHPENCSIVEPLAENPNILNSSEPLAGTSTGTITERRLPIPQNTIPLLTTINIASKSSEREKSLLIRYKNLSKKIYRLQKTTKRLKNNTFMKVINDDESVSKFLKSKISPSFALLLQGELQNFKRQCKGRRWTDESKIMALRLFKRSPTCYKLLRRLICLPTPSTLKSLLNKFQMNVGINNQIFNVLKKTTSQQTPSEREYILMFDEMSIKKNLYYNRKEDLIEGFQDHAEQGRSSQVASYALVFMVAGLRKRVKQPVAYYFSAGSVTADRLAVLLKEVLFQCFDVDMNIAATVCDLDGVNKRALGILGATVEQPYINIADQEVVTLFDTPHLLKCFRNLFMKYDIKCPTDITSNDKSGFGIAKWSHIKQFYELDNNNPNFVFAPCLKQDHLNPNTKQKMKVKLAAQVLSHSVAAGMYAKISQGELPVEAVITANILSRIDKLFDAVNASTPDLRRGKQLATNLKQTTGHLDYFKDMKIFFKKIEFLGCRRKPPSQDGWVWTLTGLERVWRNLTTKHKVIKSLATRRLQQDPLENLFGCVRANCGSNTNPTAGQFVSALKTAVLSNLSHTGVGNCELDENTAILDNFKTLFTSATDLRTDESKVIDIEILQSFENMSDDELIRNEGEMQACAYVCGFIVKNNPIDCKNCKKAFLCDTQQNTHIFVEFKEESDIKKSLNYASKDLMLCVEKSASLINNLLENEAYKKKIRNVVQELLRTSINYDFLNKCVEHKESNINYLILSIFYIVIKRFCNVKNREFASEASAAALKKKIEIVMHK